MKKLALVLALILVFILGWSARSWTGHRGMCGRGHGEHAMMCGHHGGYDNGGMRCGKEGEGCCKKMERLDCCEKSGCVKHGKLDSTEIRVGGMREGEHRCCKKADEEK